MKKWYRIGICLVLAICLLLLTACKGSPTPPANDPVQTTGQNENTDTTKSGENTIFQEEEKNNLPESLAFNWKVSFFNIEAQLNLTQLQKGMRLTYDAFRSELNRILLLNPYGPDNEYTKKLNALPYSKDFFDNNSLILIGTGSVTAALEVTDVVYANGVLKCFITRTSRNDNTAAFPSQFMSGTFYCFIEIDTVLPEGTEILVEITDVSVDKAAFESKLSGFMKECIYYRYYDSIYD